MQRGDGRIRGGADGSGREARKAEKARHGTQDELRVSGGGRGQRQGTEAGPSEVK